MHVDYDPAAGRSQGDPVRGVMRETRDLANSLDRAAGQLQNRANGLRAAGSTGLADSMQAQANRLTTRAAALRAALEPLRAIIEGASPAARRDLGRTTQ